MMVAYITGRQTPSMNRAIILTLEAGDGRRPLCDFTSQDKAVEFAKQYIEKEIKVTKRRTMKINLINKINFGGIENE